MNFTASGLSFFICKVELLTVSTSQDSPQAIAFKGLSSWDFKYLLWLLLLLLLLDGSSRELGPD